MTDEGKIKQLLDRLDDLEAQMDVINSHFNSLRDSLLTPEIKAQLDEIEAERKTSIETMQAGVQSLRDEIKAAVLEAGQTVKGRYITAIWVKGRETWDGPALKAYAKVDPKILTYLKTGEPSVTIRRL